MDDIIVWIIAWLEGNKGIKRELIQENLNQNYFEAGWIDSLGFISFISDIELEFDIGTLELDVDYEIIPAYYGTKVDDIADWNPAELKGFNVNEAVFVNDDGKRIKFNDPKKSSIDCLRIAD